MKLSDAITLIRNELRSASKNHRPFASPHEGVAIIQEECDELWEAIRRVDSFDERNDAMKHEAVQIGAMAIRFLMDLTDKPCVDRG